MMNEIRAGTSGDDMINAGNNNNVIVMGKMEMTD
jgi:hypothetical protein